MFGDSQREMEGAEHTIGETEQARESVCHGRLLANAARDAVEAARSEEQSHMHRAPRAGLT